MLPVVDFFLFSLLSFGVLKESKTSVGFSKFLELAKFNRLSWFKTVLELFVGALWEKSIIGLLIGFSKQDHQGILKSLALP